MTDYSGILPREDNKLSLGFKILVTVSGRIVINSKMQLFLLIVFYSLNILKEKLIPKFQTFPRNAHLLNNRMTWKNNKN